MDKKVAIVLNGFLALSSLGQDEFIRELNKHLKGDKPGELRKAIVESNTINFGPAPGGCPCCGK
jgi:hypothetical protein